MICNNIVPVLLLAGRYHHMTLGLVRIHGTFTLPHFMAYQYPAAFLNLLDSVNHCYVDGMQHYISILLFYISHHPINSIYFI